MKLKYNNKIIRSEQEDLFHNIEEKFNIDIYQLLLDFKQYCFLPEEYILVIEKHLVKRTTIEKDINTYLKYDLLLLKLMKNIKKVVRQDRIDDSYCNIEENNLIAVGDTQQVVFNLKEILIALKIEILEE